VLLIIFQELLGGFRLFPETNLREVFMCKLRYAVLLMLFGTSLLLSSCAKTNQEATRSIGVATNEPTRMSPTSGSATLMPATETENTASPTAFAPVQPTSIATENATETQTSSGLPNFSHVFIIILENKEAWQILGSPDAPYLNQLAHDYGLAGNYYAITHPSLPNYLALTGGDTFGIASDCNTCYVNADNIASQLSKAGKTWKAYMESMPKPCFAGDGLPDYSVNHDPFMYYDNIRKDMNMCNQVVPFTQFSIDLQAGALPDFVWITPNTCNDMHNCDIATGDAWLKTWVPVILASPDWQNNGVLFITFDEGVSQSGCCFFAAGGKVFTLVISTRVKAGYVSNSAYDHYSLLRTIETSWNLPLLGKAAKDSTSLMSDFFTNH
jgi:phosphatidylinositol-3-phosphatase